MWIRQTPSLLSRSLEFQRNSMDQPDELECSQTFGKWQSFREWLNLYRTGINLGGDNWFKWFPANHLVQSESAGLESEKIFIICVVFWKGWKFIRMLDIFLDMSKKGSCLALVKSTGRIQHRLRLVCVALCFLAKLYISLPLLLHVLAAHPTSPWLALSQSLKILMWLYLTSCLDFSNHVP